MAKARKIIKEKAPALIVDGEMQASLAFNKELMVENYPFSELADQDVNTLIFPNLSAGNIAYNLMKELVLPMRWSYFTGLEETGTHFTTWKLNSEYCKYGCHCYCRRTAKKQE